MTTLLNEREKEKVKAAIGGCTEFCRAIASVFHAPPAHPDEWVRTGRLGVLAVVFDASTKAAYLRLFHPATGTLLLEQELYDSFVYSNPDRVFHTFEAEGYVVGLAFPVDHPEEADAIFRTVQQYGGSPKSSGGGGGGGKGVSFAPQPGRHSDGGAKKEKKSGGIFGRFRKRGKTSDQRAEPEQPKTLDISGPTDFQHHCHIGWSSDAGFETRNIPKEWQELFSAAGVSEQELQDPETAKFIMETITEEVSKQNQAGADTGAAPADAGAAAASAAPPPPPPRNAAAAAPPPPPPAAPAASSGAPAPPPPPPPAAPQPAASAGAPPPPPPPPAAGSSGGPAPPPPPPPASGGGAAQGDAGGGSAAPNDLLAAIRAGKNLRKVDEPSGADDAGAAGGGGLLPQLSGADTGSLAATLSTALMARRRAMPSMGNFDDHDDDDDEWSD